MIEEGWGSFLLCSGAVPVFSGEVSNAELDKQYVWHPFTQMKEWMSGAPIVIVEGQGARLWDEEGNEYLDGNSSIWTNLHGHRERSIDRAIKKQLGRIAHTSALGLANVPASQLGAELIHTAQTEGAVGAPLTKVFYSDDGSTAIEAALKMSYTFWQRNGVESPHFLSLQGAYHGDTVGAVSVGQIPLFHQSYSRLLFPTRSVMAPYCYRCPYNRAAPERADARTYRKCDWECVGQIEETFETAKKSGQRITAFTVEPLMQGAAGMIPQPQGWLKRVREITLANEAHLIADEVLTGFGRACEADGGKDTLFACQQEMVTPDLMALAKGLTGGYVPMAATLSSQEVFDAFLGDYTEFKTFFHGHSYTGNPLGAAAALASLQLLREPKTERLRARLQQSLDRELRAVWKFPVVGDMRRVGSIAAIELVKDWRTREPFRLEEKAGIRVCEAMARRGVLTRPIGSVVVIMPPYCTTPRQVKKITSALLESVDEVFGSAAA